MHAGAPSDRNKAAENREPLKLIIHQSRCGKSDKYLCSHWKFCKCTLQVKRLCVPVCHHSKLYPAVRIESRFQFRALVRTAHRRQPRAPRTPAASPHVYCQRVTHRGLCLWELLMDVRASVLRDESHFLGFWSCLECLDKNSPPPHFWALVIMCILVSSHKLLRLIYALL